MRLFIQCSFCGDMAGKKNPVRTGRKALPVRPRPDPQRVEIERRICGSASHNRLERAGERPRRGLHVLRLSRQRPDAASTRN
jgi:hypothetical protein